MIEEYSFGHMVVDGHTYKHDLKIINETIAMLAKKGISYSIQKNSSVSALCVRINLLYTTTQVCATV